MKDIEKFFFLMIGDEIVGIFNKNLDVDYDELRDKGFKYAEIDFDKMERDGMYYLEDCDLI